jgi:hypothetical protein
VAARSGDSAARRKALPEAFRGILAEHFARYSAKGLAGIAPFDRSDGEQTAPNEQLERAFKELRVARLDAPAVQGAMADFPAAPASGIQSRFFWILYAAEGRVVVALFHRVHGVADGRATGIDRRFCLSEILNSMLAIGVAVPLAEGSVVFYANRTGTDRITGLESSIAKKIGGAILRGEFDELREAFIENAEDGS